MKYMYVIIGLMLAATLRAQTVEKTDTQMVSRLLTEARHLPSTTNYVLHFARQFLSCPYVAHTLEVNREEQLVVNTRELDCTTLVENVVALTLCMQRHLYTARDFMNALVEIRYRGGVIDGYTSRLHYFTDWIIDNTRKGLVTEQQEPNPPFTATQTINVGYMSNHPQAYKALKEQPALVPLIKTQEYSLKGRQYRYIPKQEVRNTDVLRRVVHDGDIIAITCSKAGLDIAHLGFAVWHKDGLHLLNASQLHKKVVEEPMTLEAYLQKHPSHTGLRIIRINK
jgi:hypothetical protein